MATAETRLISGGIRKAWIQLQQEGQVNDTLKLPSHFTIKKPKTSAYGVWTTSVFTRLREDTKSQAQQQVDLAALVADKWEAISTLPTQQNLAESVFAKYRIESRSTGFLNFYHRNETSCSPTIDKENRFVALQPIGRFRSCFKQKFGTPRQSLLAPSSCGVIVLNSEFNEDWLTGLDSFSHVWIIFGFDCSSSRSRADAPKNSEGGVGVFASRSPHRPSPLGLSLCQIVRVSGRQVFVTGHDVIDDTPVLDLKPLHPMDTAVPADEIRCPSWVAMGSFCQPVLDHLRHERLWYPCVKDSALVVISSGLLERFVSDLLPCWRTLATGSKNRRKVDDPQTWFLLDEIERSSKATEACQLADLFCTKAKALKRAPLGGFPPFELYDTPGAFLLVSESLGILGCA
eukprot:Gregarina_sp_Poly_1__7607@NODE_426_length_8588_cov_216_941204_g347_i0_p2_GENE_NODE_426_length_8588_cov_216_941204_g347_i0NODE_426_length_8588_cov_216_941204_g347_i0_p2_ORF_typecomplete_len402_score50_71TrmO/PF01980_16/2_2e33_NODE_426_length_8588_cov_216_941204_g347_i046285833